MNKGVIYGAAAYGLWGFFPLYFKLLGSINSVQIVAHRVIWSLAFLAILLVLRREVAGLWASLTRRTVLTYLTAAVLLAINWLVFVYSVTAGHALEASLGYFINPLINVLLGSLFLGERPRPVQWVAIGLAAAGVAYMTFSLGAFPWIALTLATSFGLYGLVKKTAPLNSLYGLSLETMLLAPPALLYLAFAEVTGSGAFGHSDPLITLLIVLLGVGTAIPLLLFASAARRIPLTTMGILQYISPTLQFFSSVFLFGEAFTAERLVGFGAIWLALIIFTLESYISHRRSLAAEAVALS